MDIETIKFNVKEIALQNELARNPESCLECRVWRLGGEMSISIHKCKMCGERKAFSNIDRIIKDFAQESNKTYDEAWDLAYECLKQQEELAIKSGKTIYFDEDYFETDLTNFYKSILTQKQIKNKIKRRRNIFCFRKQK